MANVTIVERLQGKGQAVIPLKYIARLELP